MIQYKGITFSSVDELIEYQTKEGTTTEKPKAEPKPVVLKPFIPAPQIGQERMTIKQHKFDKWTPEEHQKLKQVIDHFKEKNQKLPYGTLKKLSREMHRTVTTIAVQMTHIRQGKIKVDPLPVKKRRKGWSEEDVQVIKDFYANPSNLTKDGNAKKGLVKKIISPKLKKTPKQLADKVWDMKRPNQWNDPYATMEEALNEWLEDKM